MIPYAAGVIVPLALTLLVRNAKKDEKRGVMTSVESQVIPLGTTGSKILSALTGKTSPLSQSSLRSRARTTATDGKVFEKLHLGDCEWKTFRQTLEAVCSFASGLVQIGHKSEERVAILADTREEWFIALQGCFMRNVTVVTIYSSLGEEALCHSLNEISGARRRRRKSYGGELLTWSRGGALAAEHDGEG
ncbi:hypothetical protein Bca101_020411 [Brassica carinata]